jgi:hypothetical protein
MNTLRAAFPGDFSLGLVTFQFTGPYCSRLFYGGVWKLKFLFTPSLTLTALKMQFVKRLQMLCRTLYVASWQVYMGDGSNALFVMENISKTLYWRHELFLWIQNNDLLNCVQLYLLLCTINVLSYFQKWVTLNAAPCTMRQNKTRKIYFKNVIK